MTVEWSRILVYFYSLKYFTSLVWWCMPVIIAIWDAEAGNCLNPGIWEWPGQHSEDLSSRKHNKTEHSPKETELYDHQSMCSVL